MFPPPDQILIFILCIRHLRLFFPKDVYKLPVVGNGDINNHTQLTSYTHETKTIISKWGIVHGAVSTSKDYQVPVASRRMLRSQMCQVITCYIFVVFKNNFLIKQFEDSYDPNRNDVYGVQRFLPTHHKIVHVIYRLLL